MGNHSKPGIGRVLPTSCSCWVIGLGTAANEPNSAGGQPHLQGVPELSCISRTSNPKCETCLCLLDTCSSTILSTASYEYWCLASTVPTYLSVVTVTGATAPPASTCTLPSESHSSCIPFCSLIRSLVYPSGSYRLSISELPLPVPSRHPP